MHSEAARVVTSIVVAQSTLVVANYPRDRFVLIGRKQVDLVLVGAIKVVVGPDHRRATVPVRVTDTS